MLMREGRGKGVASAGRHRSRLHPEEERFVEHETQSAQVLPIDEVHPTGGTAYSNIVMQKNRNDNLAGTEY